MLRSGRLRLFAALLAFVTATYSALALYNAKVNHVISEGNVFRESPFAQEGRIEGTSSARDKSLLRAGDTDSPDTEASSSDGKNKDGDAGTVGANSSPTPVPSAKKNPCDWRFLRPLQRKYFVEHEDEFLSMPGPSRRLPALIKESLDKVSDAVSVVIVGAGEGRDESMLLDPLCSSMALRREAARSGYHTQGGPQDKDPTCPTVHMIEPVNETLTALEAWAKESGYPPGNMRVWNVALADDDKEIIALPEQPPEGHKPSLHVARRLDTWMNEHVLVPPKDFTTPPVVVRIDAGGYTPRIIRGTSGAIRNIMVELLMFRFNQRWVEVDPDPDFSLEHIVAMLDGFGYDAHLVSDKELIKISGRHWDERLFENVLEAEFMALPRMSEFRIRLIKAYNTDIPVCETLWG